MSWNNHRIVLAASLGSVLGLGCLVTQVAGAQQAAGTGENTLTEIIVTAQKRPELLMDYRDHCGAVG